MRLLGGRTQKRRICCTLSTGDSYARVIRAPCVVVVCRPTFSGWVLVCDGNHVCPCVSFHSCFACLSFLRGPKSSSVAPSWLVARHAWLLQFAGAFELIVPLIAGKQAIQASCLVPIVGGPTSLLAVRLRSLLP